MLWSAMYHWRSGCREDYQNNMTRATISSLDQLRMPRNKSLAGCLYELSPSNDTGLETLRTTFESQRRSLEEIKHSRRTIKFGNRSKSNSERTRSVLACHT